MIYSFNGKTPDSEKAIFIADNASVIGDVVLGSGVSVWFGAVIRGDDAEIVIGSNSNVQDNATLHCSTGHPVSVGSNVTIGHNAVVHGCRIEDDCLIGMGAVILNGAEIGKGSIVGAGALVTEGKKFPPNSLIIGVPAKAVKQLDEKAVSGILQNAEEYVETAEKYAKG